MMIRNKDSIRRRILSALLLLICIFALLSGCSKAQPESQGAAPSVESPPPAESNMNNTKEQPNPQSNSTVSDDTEGIPTGVTITKVIKDEVIKNDYRKKVELLSDGGKRVTITDSNRGIIMRHLE